MPEKFKPVQTNFPPGSSFIWSTCNEEDARIERGHKHGKLDKEPS
jgi:hypothetical protein